MGLWMSFLDCVSDISTESWLGTQIVSSSWNLAGGGGVHRINQMDPGGDQSRTVG